MAASLGDTLTPLGEPGHKFRVEIETDLRASLPGQRAIEPQANLLD
jgi:hypothetical protein